MRGGAGGTGGQFGHVDELLGDDGRFGNSEGGPKAKRMLIEARLRNASLIAFYPDTPKVAIPFQRHSAQLQDQPCLAGCGKRARF